MENFESKLESYLKSSATIVEYFLTIGITKSTLQDFFTEKSSLTPSILSQFPPFNREETQIPETIPAFCFPWGVKLSKSQNPPEAFYITLTDESGNKLHCTCLKIWELREESELDSTSEELRRSYSFNSESTCYKPKCLVIVSKLPFYETFEEILTKLYELCRITLFTKLEWFVLNLVAQVPSPARGHTLVTYKLGDLEKEFKLPPMNRLPLLDLNLGALFLSLSIENLMKVFLCLTLECSLVFVSNDDNKLSKCVISLLSLLFPFQWSLVCVPILPEVLLDYLYSPVSYIYGISSKLNGEVKLRGGESLFIIDLDNDSVVCNAAHLKVPDGSSSPVDLPPLPPHYARKLFRKVTKILESSKIDKKLAKKEQKLGPQVCSDLREAFFQFFVSILKDYKRFMNFNNSIDQPSCFDDKKFIKIVPESSKPYFSRFLKTQMFANFCETRLRPQNIEEHSENLLFDESILAKLNRSRLRYKKFETPFVVDSSQSYKPWKVPEISPMSDMRTFSYSHFPDITIESVQDYPLPKEKLPKFQESIDFSYSIINETKTSPGSSEEQILFCWLQMWSACLWYQDVSEHGLRYKELISSLQKLKQVSSVSLTGIYKIILEAVARVNPSLGMPVFKLMTDSQVMVDAATIHLLQRILALSMKKDQKQVKSPNSIFFTNSPINDNFMPNLYRRRVFSKPNDSHIFAKQELCFLIKETCKNCKKFLNSQEVQDGWQSNLDSFECFCTGCKEKYTPNLRVRIGLEVGHQQKTSNKETTIFFSPSALKSLVIALLADASTKFKLDVELFRIYNANLFWNLIWHFNNNQLPFEFMLPYEHEVVDVRSSFIVVGEETQEKVKVDKEVQTEWTIEKIQAYLKKKRLSN